VEGGGCSGFEEARQGEFIAGRKWIGVLHSHVTLYKRVSSTVECLHTGESDRPGQRLATPHLVLLFVPKFERGKSFLTRNLDPIELGIFQVSILGHETLTERMLHVKLCKT